MARAAGRPHHPTSGHGGLRATKEVGMRRIGLLGGLLVTALAGPATAVADKPADKAASSCPRSFVALPVIVSATDGGERDHDGNGWICGKQNNGHADRLSIVDNRS